MTAPGLAALPEGDRIDFARLRRDRTDRLFAAMEQAGLDALILGHPADVTFASGARQLWTAGSRPFSAACVLILEDQRLHLMTTWDEGVPPEIPREHLYGLSWNPVIMARQVSAIPGLDVAQRIGAAGSSAGVRRMVSSIAPQASLVDARDLVHQVRAVKSADEIAAVETACALAEAGLEAMATKLRPGVTARQLLATLADRLGHLGAPVLPDGSVACSTTNGFAAVPGDDPLGSDELAALSPSATYAGYEGTLARTFAVGGPSSTIQDHLGRRCRETLDAVIAHCVPGGRGRALVDTWTAAGGSPSTLPLAYGIGLGAEPPVIGPAIGQDAQLRAGMVLAVQAWSHEPGVGGWLERDVVAVTAQGPQLLTRWRRP